MLFALLRYSNLPTCVGAESGRGQLESPDLVLGAGGKMLAAPNLFPVQDSTAPIILSAEYPKPYAPKVNYGRSAPAQSLFDVFPELQNDV